jgi:hypothetical protein
MVSKHETPLRQPMRLRRLSMVIALSALSWAQTASAQPLGSPARVAVQPVSGAPTLLGASLRAQITRLLHDRGYRVVPSMPSVEGIGQYQALARDHRLTAFVVSDLDDRKIRKTLIMLVVDGAHGSVLGQWSISGRATDLGKVLAKGFWKHLGPLLEKSRAPDAPAMQPGPPVHTDVD